MSVKIRLARKGRKRLAFYHIVVADSRAPRDGRFIEKIGTYNPVTDPATIDIDFDKALEWLNKGAQPTDTCRAILSYKGVMMKKHLLEGVRKGAFDEAEADRRFNEWLKGKEEKIELKRSGLEKRGEEDRKKRLEAERAIKEARAAEYARRAEALAAEAEAAARAAAGEAEEVAAAEESAEEVAAEAVTEPVADSVEGAADNAADTADSADTAGEPDTEAAVAEAARPAEAEPVADTAEAAAEEAAGPASEETTVPAAETEPAAVDAGSEPQSAGEPAAGEEKSE